MQRAYVVTIDDDSPDEAEIVEIITDGLESVGLVVIQVNPWGLPEQTLGGTIPP